MLVLSIDNYLYYQVACMKTYLHKTTCRLRIRSDFIREHPEVVSDVVSNLEGEVGITEICYRRYAGSVAIRFDPDLHDCDSLLSRLDRCNWTSGNDNGALVKNTLKTGAKSAAKGAGMLLASRYLGQSLFKVITAVA